MVRLRVGRNDGQFEAFYALFCGAMLIGFAPIFAKKAVAFGGVSPIGAGFWRMAFGSAFLSILLLKGRKAKKELQAIALSPFIIGAGLCFACDLTLWHSSFEFTSVANASMLANVSSLIVPIWGAFFYKEKLSRPFVFGALIAFGGVVGLMIGGGIEPIPGRTAHEELIGDGLALLTAFSYAGYLILVKKLSGATSPLLISWASSTWSSVILLIICFVGQQKVWPQRREEWFYLVCLGVISHAMGQGLVAVAIRKLPVSLTSVMLLSAPTASVFFSVAFLGQYPTLIQCVGAIFVMIGIALAVRRKTKSFV